MSTTAWKNPIALYYMARWLHEHHVPVLPKVLQTLLFVVFGAVVPYRAQLGPGCRLAHGGNGVVIHYLARLGRNVMILQQVTIGGSGQGVNVPRIGNDVYLGTGAKILGDVEIGDSCVIGANAVVVKSVPAGSVAVGVPARVIRSGVDAHTVETW